MRIKNLSLIFSLSIFLFFVSAKPIKAASLSISPNSGTYAKGSTIKVNIGINTAGEAINAVQANLVYPAEKLQFVSISTSGSVLTIIAEKGGGGGFVKIAGGTPTPGFSGNKFIASVNFLVLSDSGSATLTFAGDSSVLRDSNNTEALTSKGSATFNFTKTSTVVTKNEDDKESQLTISDVRVENLDKKSVTIVWKTNKEATSVVNYGQNPKYSFSESSDDFVKEHKINLNPELLVPGTTYHFSVKSVDKQGNEVSSADSTFSLKGYTLIIKVLNTFGKALKGVEVTLHSTPQKGVTDEKGEVTFKDVSPGKHGLTIKYLGSTKIDEVEVSEDETPQIVEKKIQTKPSLSLLASRKNLFIFGTLAYLAVALLIVLLVVFLRLRKRHSRILSKDQTVVNFPESQNDIKIDSSPPQGQS